MHTIPLILVSGIPDEEGKTQKDKKHLSNLIVVKQQRAEIPGRQGGVGDGDGDGSKDSRKEWWFFFH